MCGPGDSSVSTHFEPNHSVRSTNGWIGSETFGAHVLINSMSCFWKCKKGKSNERRKNESRAQKSDLEVLITRTFAAPAHLVWEAMYYAGICAPMVWAEDARMRCSAKSISALAGGGVSFCARLMEASMPLAESIARSMHRNCVVYTENYEPLGPGHESW